MEHIGVEQLDFTLDIPPALLDRRSNTKNQPGSIRKAPTLIEAPPETLSADHFHTPLFSSVFCLETEP